MNTPESSKESIYRHVISVPAEAMDQNGHVNNVVYVQWMQDVAILHSDSVGCTAATAAAGASWVARSHHIEYLSPAFAGDRIEALTWVADFRRVRSMRRYRFVRPADGKILAQGETDWVFIDLRTGRPRAIPDAVSQAFILRPEGPGE